jgi:tetratricopeptide (TPR) repeat protein
VVGDASGAPGTDDLTGGETDEATGEVPATGAGDIGYREPREPDFRAERRYGDRDRRDVRDDRGRGVRDDRGRGPRDDRGFRGPREDRGPRGERDRRGSRDDRERAPRGGARGYGRGDDLREGSAVEAAPSFPEDINPRALSAEVRDELRSLSQSTADAVARHLVAAGQLLDDEPEEALAHARAARQLAPRIAAVREALGLAAYRNGEWQSAIAELRTYHRLTGRQTHLAVIADSERALGRPERAVDIYRTADRSKLEPSEAVELLIVAAGARGDLGQREAAVAMLQVRELASASREPWVARLRYAYADSLLTVGRRDEAREWFARAAEIDDELTTDATERMLDLDGVVLDDTDQAFDEDLDDEDVDDKEADEEEEDLDPDDEDEDFDAVAGHDADLARKAAEKGDGEPDGRQADR